MMYIKTLQMTCEACPSQWEGETICGKQIYIRYRGGYLRVDIDGVGNTVWGVQCGGQFDGVMDTTEMLNKVRSVLRVQIATHN
jgi:hypothetical protein